MKVAIKTNIGLEHMQIDLIHSIEKAVDNAMAQNGFTRTTSTKADDHIKLNYRQFAAAGVSEDNA